MRAGLAGSLVAVDVVRGVSNGVLPHETTRPMPVPGKRRQQQQQTVVEGRLHRSQRCLCNGRKLPRRAQGRTYPSFSAYAYRGQSRSLAAAWRTSEISHWRRDQQRPGAVSCKLYAHALPLCGHVFSLGIRSQPNARRNPTSKHARFLSVRWPLRASSVRWFQAGVRKCLLRIPCFDFFLTAVRSIPCVYKWSLKGLIHSPVS
jgi:hypothetical protein